MNKIITLTENVANFPDTMRASGDKRLVYKNDSDVFQIYRRSYISPETGPLFPEERRVFLEVFSMLAKNSIPSLIWNSSKLVKLQQQVRHIHPFNFLEAVVHYPPLKKCFLSVVERGGFVWNECFSRFKLNLELQDSMNNVAPHIEDFSRKVQLEGDSVKEILSKDRLLPTDVKSLILNLPENVTPSEV